ncbi:MAG: ATPase, T2SS/T4P/T4SS family [Candidatus Heimdallarchaeaceae archaeon]
MKTDRISEYKIKGYKIKITNDGDYRVYSAEPKYDFDQDPLVFTELSSIVFKNKGRLGKKILKFDELIGVLKSIFMWKILELNNLPTEPDIFAELFIHKLIKLDRIIPLFLDDGINEIYMDQMNSPLYVDHKIFGRCNTEIVLEEEEIRSLIARLKLEHPISITTKKPSLKIEFKTIDFHMRISMDFPPLSPNGPTFNIRKFHKKPLKIIDLIKLETLPSFIAAYLVEVVNNRKNITIIGEPSSGKTTLANAIDLYTPKHWRKIAIEDAIESINQTELGYKQLSIQVDSFESNRSLYTKTSEILKLLHRSPDWIYLGEIQSSEHTKAMFEALNAGLKGIQTAHADSVEKILRRWENLHKISVTDFLSLETIIIMKREILKNNFIRTIAEIYEVNTKNPQLELKYGFLTKVYDASWDKKRTMSTIREESFIKEKIDSIIERGIIFQQRVEKKKKQLLVVK